MPEFLSEIETLRRNARRHIDQGPITDPLGFLTEMAADTSVTG
jgi:hypothetical protein